MFAFFSLNALLEMLTSFLWKMAAIVQDFVIGVIQPLIDPLLDALPEGFGDTMSDFASYASFANQWVPLDLGLVLFVAYWTFVIVWAGVRMVVSAIPGVW